ALRRRRLRHAHPLAPRLRGRPAAPGARQAVRPDRFQQLQIPCGAPPAGVVLLNVVLTVLLATGALRPVPLPRPPLIALFAVGVVLLVASPAAKGAVFKRIGAEGFGADTDRIFAAYRTSNLIAFALREAGGCIGLLLSVHTADPWWSWSLGASAVIAMIFDWPKRDHLGL